MIENKTIKIVTCDMCRTDITNYPKYSIQLKGFKWDLCEHCHKKLNEVMSFLTITVGLEIEYKLLPPSQGDN